MWGVCVFELGLFFHLSRSSLARATRQAAHTSNYANQAAARDGAFRRGVGEGVGVGVGVIDCHAQPKVKSRMKSA